MGEAFPRVIWQNGDDRIVRLDETGVAIEHRSCDSMNMERWDAVWDPNSQHDIVVGALFEVLGEK